MAAFAAHGLHDPNALRIVESGVRMQGWHALALLGTALWTPRGGWLAACRGGGVRDRDAAVLRRGVFAGSGRGFFGRCGARRRHHADAGLAAARGVRRCAPDDPSRLPGRRRLRGAAGRGTGPSRRRDQRLARPAGPVPRPAGAAAWALDIWTDPREIEAPSVKSAADALRAIQRNWAAYGVGHHRRMALIAERLPPVKARPLVFPEPAPSSHLGAWTLLAADRLLVSAAKSVAIREWRVPVRGGSYRAAQPRILKLWEALTRFGRWPAAGQTCLDLGASPRRLDLGPGEAGRERDRGGQGPARRRPSRRCRG